MCHNLKRNELTIVIGYCNNEGLLYTIADADIIATGTYENLRMFSMNRWEEPERRTGPRGRYYSPALLNWVDSAYLDTINRRGLLESIVLSNEHSDALLSPGFTWNFQKASIYEVVPKSRTIFS